VRVRKAAERTIKLGSVMAKLKMDREITSHARVKPP
jgi:hypothetical protein